MSQTLALRKYISSQQQASILASINQKPSLPFTLSSNNGSTNFDVTEFTKLKKPSEEPAASCSILPGKLINFDAVNKSSSYQPQCVELVDSREWLRRYGLKTNKLNLESILGLIGFKQSKDYVNQIHQMISSRYSKGLFLQTQTKDGYIYNITVNEAKLTELAIRLEESINLFKMRLNWLNSDSRRIFGVIGEKRICIVIDCKNRDRSRFSQYKACLLRLLREQVAQIASFNIIRCSDKIELFQEKSVLVSSKSIEEALAWINNWMIDFKAAPPADTITTEAVLEAFKDDTIDGIYLISEGTSSNGSREILYDKLVKHSKERKISLNVISFNCDSQDTVEFLRRVAQNSFGPGRFHAYCLTRHYDDYVRGSIDAEPTKTMVIANQRMLGGAPPNIGLKSDVMLIYDEIEKAREAMDSVKAIIEAMNARNNVVLGSRSLEYAKVSAEKKQQEFISLDAAINEDYMSSAQWLKKFGISARNLDFFEFLRKLTFRHCDGVVDLMKEPSTGKLYFIRDGVTYYQGDSVPSPKLVNAKYCDQFAHVLWNDGTIMHVHVAPEMNRSYEEKMKILLDQIQKRIEWLSRGSRELFGTVVENRICILIDTSQSMQLSLEFVKNKLIALIQEQLRAKQRFNLLAFNSKVHPWRDRMVEVDEFNVLSAFEWINELSAQGTTNTLGALRFALADPKTEAIYLLSDGRPDQDPRQILSQIHLNTQIPIHTISFNCNDADANRFLSQLAKETDGRYHYFNENGWNADPNGPVPYESHDISLLKNEMETGLKYLSQLTKLREECALLTKNKPAVVEKKLIKSTFTSPEFTVSSKSTEFQSKHRSKTSFDKYKAMNSNPVESTLGSLNEIQSLDWILPETRELLERQYKLQMSHHHSKSEIAFNATSSSSSTPLQQKPTEKKSVAKQIKPISADSSLLKSHSKIQTWLEKNSLSRLKLTIFDVLLSLSTKKKKKHDDNEQKQEAENLLIVNDLFEARVWNEILDSAQSSGIDKNRFKFINPASINLSDYEKKLEKQIHIYKKYLADTIWKSLTDIERTVLDNQAPLEFDETNKESLLKGLQYCNWPIKQKDIEAVEKEIELAKRYLRLAQELSYYILGKVESGREKIVSVNRELDSKEKEEKSPREDNNPLVSALISTRSSPRKLDKTEIDRIMSAPAKKEDFISRGDRVIARNDLLGYYFNGKVTKVSDSRHATVKFENGAKQDKMSFRNILKLNGPSPYISLGDYVMASVLNEFEQKCWVPGIVQLIDQNSFPKLYTILYFNGQEGENTRPELIKINKSAYGFIVNYIRGRLGLSGTSLRTFREDTKLPPPPEPKPLEPGGPEIDYLKKDIIDEIKSHFDSLKLDDKYQRMYDELVLLRKKQKNYKSDLEGKFKVLRNDFDEWRKQEPPVVLPNPNMHLYEKARDESSSKKVVVTSPPSSQRDASTTEQKIAKLRADLPELRPGEEVLAKWPDDGWYYRSIVKEYLGKYRYQVEDSLRDVEQIYREDIVSELHDASDTFEEGDPVVALHPKYEFSYAPGQIVRVSSDMSKLLVKFYDYEESVVVRNEVYKLPRLKYQLDVTNIINLEKRWIGQTVVARNNFSNVYELGKVVNRVGNGRQYTIEWSNGKQSIQNANHIFGKYTRNQQILNNDYVLAPKETIFLPGRVLSQQGDQLRVKFVDGKIDENVSLQQCYWLSRDYYEDACNFYTQKNNADSDSDEGVKSNDDSDGSASMSRSGGGGRRTPVIDANEFRAKKSTSSMISEKSSTTRIISSPSRPKTKGSSRRDDDDSDTFEAD